MLICTSLHQIYPTLTPSLSNPNAKIFKTFSLATLPISQNRLLLKPITIERLPTKYNFSSLSSSLSFPKYSEELPQSVQEIIKIFQSIEDHKAKYDQLLLNGKILKPLDPRYRIPENKVQGCVNQLWIRAYLESESDIVVYEAFSPSELVKGLVALLVKGLSSRTLEEILGISSDFLVSLDLRLTPSRTNEFLNIFKFMQEKAKRLNMMKMKKDADRLRGKRR